MVFFIFYKFIYFIIYKIIYTYTYYTLLLNKINYLVSQAALSTLYHVEFLGTRSLKTKCSVCKCGHVHHNIFSRLYLEYNFMTISYTFITYKFFINYILSGKKNCFSSSNGIDISPIFYIRYHSMRHSWYAVRRPHHQVRQLLVGPALDQLLLVSLLLSLSCF